MPSKDSFHEKNPKYNQRAGLGQESSKKETRQMAPHILRLAQRLEMDPDELASRIPADTIRRLKYPVIEQVAEDGTRSYTHDLGIEVGRRALI